MSEFISIELLATLGGCSTIVTLLTQVLKKYIPTSIDTKWLALALSIIIGVLRIIYVGQFNFDGIVSGILNIFVLLSISIGIYEVASSTVHKVTDIFKK